MFFLAVRDAPANVGPLFFGFFASLSLETVKQNGNPQAALRRHYLLVQLVYQPFCKNPARTKLVNLCRR